MSNIHAELLFDSAHGNYIPQRWFEECAGTPGWKGYNFVQCKAALSSPEHEFYWEQWIEVLDHAYFFDGVEKWLMVQDGDVWLLREKDVEKFYEEMGI